MSIEQLGICATYQQALLKTLQNMHDTCRQFGARCIAVTVPRFGYIYVYIYMYIIHRHGGVYFVSVEQH